MHCTNCGTYIAPGGKYCAGCGQATIDPEMTRLAESGRMRSMREQGGPNDVERVIFKTRPTLLFIKAGYVTAAIAALLLVALLALVRFIDIPWFVAIPLGMSLLLIPAYYHLKRNSVAYTLTDSKIEIDQGLISRTTRNIPLRNIQDVTVSATVLQRMLGYGNLIVDNASEIGGSTVLKNIQDPRKHADLLLKELRRWH
jgi:membrane protein YdbS with pleckstrin-like domain